MRLCARKSLIYIGQKFTKQGFAEASWIYRTATGNSLTIFDTLIGQSVCPILFL